MRMSAARGTVEFRRIGPNAIIPSNPWPQTFYISRTMLMTDAVEVRPLTIGGIIKGVGRNFITMNFWRLCWILRGLGFLKTEEAGYYRWHDLTFRFWRYHQLHRFRWVRWVHSTYSNLSVRG